MPILHCIAEGCTADSRKGNDDISFYPLPKVRGVRNNWLKLIRRDGLKEQINANLARNPQYDLRHLVVCSQHFEDSEPTPLNPYPTLFRYNSFKRGKDRKTKNSSGHRNGNRANLEVQCHVKDTPLKKIRLIKEYGLDKSSVCYPYVSGEMEVELESNESEHIPVHLQTHIQDNIPDDHIYARNTYDDNIKYQQMLDEINRLSTRNLLLESDIQRLTNENKLLTEENLSLKKQLENNAVNMRNMIINKITESDKSVKHFIGLPSLTFLLGFLTLITPLFNNTVSWKGASKGGEKRWQNQNNRKPGKQRKLTIKEEFIIVMLKIRLGLDNLTLSYLFGVSLSHISNMFATWVNFLSQYLDPIIKWPSIHKIRKHMPLSFKLKYPNTTSIIDCTEIYIQKPRNSSAQSATWSNYKTHNTLKALVAIQPNGAFTFISNLWSGNISDRRITELSGYLDHIKAGDEVMADRGFQIRDLLLKKGAKLNMPPFTRASNNSKGKTLTSREIKETRKIASVRIHVERAIRRLKTFKLLGHILPIKMKNLSSPILKIAAAFCNLLSPLVNKYKK